MLILRRSSASGIVHEKDIHITDEQLQRVTDGGENIDNVCPRLSAEEKLFIMSGITAEESKQFFEHLVNGD